MAVELSIIIVNWNGREFLPRCIESILRSPPNVSYNIIVVDNASTDDSLRHLRSEGAQAGLGKARLHVIENTENLGFSRANNQAIAYSDAPLLFLLNSDTEVKPGAIDTLIATLKSDKRIGACGPRLLNSDGSLQPSTGRNPATAWDILVLGLRIYRLIPRSIRGELLLGIHWNHNRRRRVNFLSGAAILAKREMIGRVGGLDERFHMYGEDAEWCLRIVRAGWSLVFEPEAIVTHHGGQSSMQRWSSPERVCKSVDGNLRFRKYCLSRWHLITYALASSLVASTAHIWRSLRGHPTTETKMVLGLYAKYLKQAFLEK